MSELKKSDHILAKQLLATFALHGFQKTSMQDLANGAGVSRQSIYKKFGSKVKCYSWVIETYLRHMYTNIFEVLDDNSLDPEQGLIKTFDIFIGEAVETTSHAHGTEILDDTLKATHSSEEDWPLRFRARLADYLTRHDLVDSKHALGVAYALISAGKGLLIEEYSRNNYEKNIKLIISSVIRLE